MKPILIACALLATAAAAAPQRQVPELTLPLRVTGGLISGAGIGNPTGTARVEIVVTRWSTAVERGQLLDALSGKGQDALLDKLIHAPSVGSIRVNTQLAWDLRYARLIPQDEGGTRVFLATDRPMSIAEIWNDPRYSQYPFTLIDLRFGPDGAPTGTMMLAARVTADKDGRFVNVESFATEPIQLTDLHVERAH